MRQNATVTLNSFRRCLGIFLLVVFSNLSSIAMGATGSSSGPYCGIQCVYAALKISGLDVRFADLVDPRYVGSYKGSTIQELRAAAEAHGLHSKPLKNLTIEELRHSSYLMILNTKSIPWVNQYNHYVLYIGQKDGNALLLNPPSSLLTVPFAHLASSWNGVALILSTEPVKLRSIYATFAVRYACIVVIVLAAVLILREATRRLMKRPLHSVGTRVLRSVWQLLLASTCGIAVGALWHGGYEGGLLANAEGSKNVALAHLMDYIDKVDVKQVPALLQSHTVFVDARLPDEYKRGHIRGAIHVPPTFGDEERAVAMTGIARCRKVVVYCSNAQCGCPRIVALNLARDGFTNLAFFSDGWSAYEATETHVDDLK